MTIHNSLRAWAWCKSHYFSFLYLKFLWLPISSPFCAVHNNKREQHRVAMQVCMFFTRFYFFFSHHNHNSCTIHLLPFSSVEEKSQAYSWFLFPSVQSLDNAELKLLGRNHTACDALRTLEEAKKLFPGRTSIDLIFGLPGQTVASWVQGLEKALAVCDDHISLYQLTLERGTSLFKQVHQGFLPTTNVDIVSEMYECARQVLQNSGFYQYEVSNFSKNVSLFL